MIICSLDDLSKWGDFVGGFSTLLAFGGLLVTLYLQKSHFESEQSKQESVRKRELTIKVSDEWFQSTAKPEYWTAISDAMTFALEKGKMGAQYQTLSK